MRERLLNEVMLELQEIRRRNEETERARRKQAREEVPGLADLMDRREEMIHGSLRGILMGKSTPEDLPEKMEKVSAQIRGKLRENGYPEDYLSPVYACAVCRDTGYVGDRIRERCACVRERYQRKLRQAIGLTEEERETFETFDPGVFPAEKEGEDRYSQREAMVIIRNLCERWADEYPRQQPRDLVLSGKSGLGKTFLLHALANRLLSRGVQVLLLSSYSYLEMARRSFLEDDGGMEELMEAEVLMLDDLGSEPLMKNITIEGLYSLINERQRKNRATVISTNLNQEELRDRYTERFASRITDRRNCLYLPLEGQDIRYIGGNRGKK